LLVVLLSASGQLHVVSAESETCDARDDDADEREGAGARESIRSGDERRPEPPPGFRAPRHVHGFRPPIYLPLLCAEEARRAAREVHALREHWDVQSANSTTSSYVASQDLSRIVPQQRDLSWYTLGPAGAYSASPGKNEFYRRRVAVVAPLLRERLGFVYDAVQRRLSEHLNETVAWKEDCGVPGLHIHPADLALERGVDLATLYMPPHTDMLHNSQRWPAWVEVNAPPHHTIAATVALQLPRTALTGLRIYPFYQDPFARRWVADNGSAIGGDLEPAFSEAIDAGGGTPSHAYFQRLIADGHFKLQPYATGGLSVHSGESYHSIMYVGALEKGDFRITLQIHGMWTVRPLARSRLVLSRLSNYFSHSLLLYLLQHTRGSSGSCSGEARWGGWKGEAAGAEPSVTHCYGGVESSLYA